MWLLIMANKNEKFTPGRYEFLQCVIHDFAYLTDPTDTNFQFHILSHCGNHCNQEDFLYYSYGIIYSL